MGLANAGSLRTFTKTRRFVGQNLIKLCVCVCACVHVCVFRGPESRALNVCVDLQTSAWRCNLICRKEWVGSHDRFKGPLAQGCASVRNLFVCVCVDACMCACMLVCKHLVFICFHKVHRRKCLLEEAPKQ